MRPDQVLVFPRSGRWDTVLAQRQQGAFMSLDVYCPRRDRSRRLDEAEACRAFEKRPDFFALE